MRCVEGGVVLVREGVCQMGGEDLCYLGGVICGAVGRGECCSALGSLLVVIECVDFAPQDSVGHSVSVEVVTEFLPAVLFVLVDLFWDLRGELFEIFFVGLCACFLVSFDCSPPGADEVDDVVWEDVEFMFVD